jgi:hypothetical protein
LKPQRLRDKEISDAETKYESVNDSVENNFINPSAKQKIYPADIYSDEQAKMTETKENMKSENTET